MKVIILNYLYLLIIKLQLESDVVDKFFPDINNRWRKALSCKKFLFKHTLRKSA